MTVARGGFALAQTPPHESQTPTHEYQTEIESWHKERIARLTKPDGYLSLTGLFWLTESPQTFPGIGQAHLEGSDVLFRFTDGVSLDGQEISESRVTPEMSPVFQQGSSHFVVLRHGQKIGIRVRDPHSPIRANFSGVERFPLDPNWRLLADFELDEATIPVASIVDETTQQGSPGYAVFDWQGEQHKLRLIGEPEEESYFLVFSDASAGNETYSACRFLEVDKTDDGRLIVDFNKAYNPPCSMTPFATCPLPPEGNILPFEILAGERYSKDSSR